jgi:hypothetical protein
MAAAKFKAAVDSNSKDPSFAEAITTAYATTSDDVRELRDVVEDTLARDRSFLERRDIEATVGEVHGLAFALLRKVMPHTPRDDLDTSPSTPAQVSPPRTVAFPAFSGRPRRPQRTFTGAPILRPSMIDRRSS